MQSSLSTKVDAPLHVAIIMDGNGRWAAARGLPRIAGHQAGAAALRRIVEAAPRLGITTLSVYAFSTENWSRPVVEVSALMQLLARFLQHETSRLVDAGVRLTVIGRRDRLQPAIAEAIDRAEDATAAGTKLDLRVAFNYSGRGAILDAVGQLGADGLSSEAVSQRLEQRGGGPDIDLLLRTSGEQRLSGFMLWEVAYAELHFTPTLWPDFGCVELSQALDAFRTRDRRYGGLTARTGHAASPPDRALA